MTEASPIYREVQAEKPWWVWVIAIGIAGAAWIGLAFALAGDAPSGEQAPPRALTIAVVVVLAVGLPAFVHALRLVVEVRPGELRWRLRPLFGGRLALHGLRSIAPRTYRPIREYLGWGLRWTPHAGWAITLSGNRGVQLELATGRRVLVGSDRPDVLAEAIRSASD